MKIIQGIVAPLVGEHALDAVPRPAPYTRTSAQLVRIQKRLNLYPQRTLTSLALTDEQRGRMARVAQLAQAVAPGVISGLDVALEGAQLVVLPGRAVTAAGEDIRLRSSLRVSAEAVPLNSEQLLARLTPQPQDAQWRARIGAGERITLAELRTAARLDLLPHAMVLTARPIAALLDERGELDSPCFQVDNNLAASAISWQDAFALEWVPWPLATPLPPWTSDGTTVDPRFRNRLAYAIFNRECERRADDPRWPWEELGVALSLVGFDAAFASTFADCNAVVRQGGGRRNRSALLAQAGDDTLWRARVAQFLEHLAELQPADRRAERIAQRFDWLPPAGVLPRDAVDFGARRQFVFPPTFDVQAQPIALEMVDALMAESASLAPLSISLPSQVQLLVPVPARLYDPELLQLDERINPLFDLEIARLAQRRLDLLSRRDGLRRRADLLSQAIDGRIPDYPQDDPEALPDERDALDAAVFNRVRRVALDANAASEHGFAGATSRLRLQGNDALIAFVRVDAAPAALELKLTLDGRAEPVVLHWPSDAARSTLALPTPDSWQRLTVPLADFRLPPEAAASAIVTGMAFRAVAGAAAVNVLWGYAGRLTNGREAYWLNDALPAGATASGTWNWIEQGAGLDESLDQKLGFAVSNDARDVGEFVTLRRAYRDAPGGLVRELGETWQDTRTGPQRKGGGPTDIADTGEDVETTMVNGQPQPVIVTSTRSVPSDQPPLAEQGLDELIARLGTRIAAADDHVEFGFLRARTDIFRLRQGILGTDRAAQLLTSPAAAELVSRSKTVAATEQEFDEYFKRAATTAVAAPPPAAPPSAARAPTAAPARASRTALVSRLAPVRLFSPAPVRDVLATVTPVSMVTEVSGPVALSPAAIAAVATRSEGPLGAAAASDVIAARGGAGGLLPSARSAAVSDVVNASLFGTVTNTITVGQRLNVSPAVETKNAAAAGKTRFVVDSLPLLAAKGIALDGIEIPGARLEGTKATAIGADKALAQLAKFRDLDAGDPSEPAEVNEAGYFKRGLQAIDSMVRFLRGVELRADDYRRLQRDAIAARDRVTAALHGLRADAAALEGQLAEVRHDLQVARALRAEEMARVAARIARRLAILQENVPYLVFRRPRTTQALDDVPLREAQPALVENLVPHLRAAVGDLPPELQQMVNTLKDVPARWFKTLPALVDKFDRIDNLRLLLDRARERVAVTATPPIQLVEAAATPTAQRLQVGLARHVERVQFSLQKSALQLANVNAGSWKEAAAQLKEAVSISDLLVTARPNRAVTLAAAGLLDDIAGVAGGLYEAFCRVPPALRLRWAESFSQLDADASLRQLSVLPGFGQEPGIGRPGLDYIEWKQMQGMVDWLFSIISADADAVAAINDLVQVCLLLAAHAPVKRILAARIKQPVVPVPNAPFTLHVDPRVVRVGMQVLVHAPATNLPIARGVIEDVLVDGAAARVSDVLTPGVTLDESMRVTLQSGPALSSGQAQARESKSAASSSRSPDDARQMAQAGLQLKQRLR